MHLKPKHIAAAVLALGLAGCSGGPDYYMLPAQQVPSERYPGQVSSVVVSEISLPAYAEAVEIAVLKPEGAVALEPNVSWADEPRRGLTRHLASALEARLGGRVATDPWPAVASDPTLRVEVAVDRLIGSPGGQVWFSGQVFITRPEDGSIFASERFNIIVPPQGEDFVGLAAGHARAVERLADQIAARIAGRSRPTT